MQEDYEKMMDLYFDVKRDVQRKDRVLFERWKAGGFIIDPDIISFYPNLGQVITKLEEKEPEEIDESQDKGA